MRPLKTTLVLLCGLLTACLQAFGQNVRVWQANLDIPTYLLGAEDPNPPFPLADAPRIYPYTLLDDLTNQREVKTYKAVYLENDYLKATILPEMGGHLYSLYDKVNKREVFYRNNVVKYGLVGRRGAWVSGGVEFNFPHGHTDITVSPVAYTTLENPDGSATVVVGDVDLVSEMHWEVALTLHPGQARLEQRVTLFNDTGIANPYWYWANSAVPATDDMRFIYPMREANPHSHEEIWTFPLHDGTDYSWYKDIRHATSLFARQVHRNFFGAYYENSDYGVVHVADFHQVVGKKTWTWGVGGDGLIWTDLLTDHDGAYNEIQSGRFETQLTYEFMPPRRVEEFTEFWYPLHGLGGGFVEATPRLALNANFEAASVAAPAHVEVVLFPTEAISAAHVIMKQGTRVLTDSGPLDLAPMTPLKVNALVDDVEAAKSQLEVTVTGAGHQVLLHWSAADPVDGNPNLVPAAGVHPLPHPSPESMTVEQLYLSGVEAEKDGAEQSAAAAYRATLQRDPGYVPALIKMVMHSLQAGDDPSADKFLSTALARDDRNPETLYAAGLVRRAEHQWSLAQDMFWAELRFEGDPAPAYAQLGEIALVTKDYPQAIALLEKSYEYNPEDGIVEADLAVALRLSVRASEAEKTINQLLDKMPLLPYANAERWVIATAGEWSTPSTAAPGTADWTKIYPATAETTLQVAAWYRSLGDVKDSDAVLHLALKQLPAEALTAVVYYELASNARARGNDAQAEDFARQAEAAPYAKVFPNRLADAEVIGEQLRHLPQDAHALYLMGNFLFAHDRYEDGARCWTQAAAQGFEYSVLMRNLGLYSWRIKNDLPAAAGYYEKAVKLDPEDYRLYTDLDEIYFRLGKTSLRERLFADAPADVRSRDTVIVRQALLLTQKQDYDRALGLFQGHNFKPWEGGLLVRQTVTLADLQKGRKALQSNQPAAAEAAFRQAREYPANLGSGKPDQPHDEEAWFWLGEALAAQNKPDAARDAWREAAKEGQTDEAPLGSLYQGLALRRLGQNDASAKALDPLLHVKVEGKHAAPVLYAAGLLDLYNHQDPAAAAHLSAALEADPAYWQARLMLAELKH